MDEAQLSRLHGFTGSVLISQRAQGAHNAGAHNAGENTTNSEKSIFGIIITKSIKTTCQWSQQSLQTIARPPALFWHL